MIVLLKMVDSAVVQVGCQSSFKFSLMHCSLSESLGKMEGHLNVWEGL